MRHKQGPDWAALRALARVQLGWFTTQQARAVGFSAQMLSHNLALGRFHHAWRGLYRLADAPVHEREHLVAALLWSRGAGVLSHTTSLALFGAFDGVPGARDPRIHLTVPDAWAHRRLRVPDEVMLHHERLALHELVWLGWGYATHPTRAIAECESLWMERSQLAAAMHRAIALGLTSAEALGAVHQRVVFRAELAAACAERARAPATTFSARAAAPSALSWRIRR